MLVFINYLINYIWIIIIIIIIIVVVEILETLFCLMFNLNAVRALPLDALRRQIPLTVPLIYLMVVPSRLKTGQYLILLIHNSDTV